MAKFMVKGRRIVVEGEPYTCSISQGAEGIELLVYRDKRQFLRLRQNFTEAWGINLYRPGVIAQTIRYYRKKGGQGEPRQLHQEPELFSQLTDLCFSLEEQAEKKRFLQVCTQMRERLESESKIKPEGE